MPKPEIPQDVFFGDNKPAARAESKPAARKTPKKPARRQAVKKSNGQKVQVTIYLSDQAMKDLEKARFELLNSHDVKVPKSAIAEYAICKAAEDIAAMAEALADEQ